MNDLKRTLTFRLIASWIILSFIASTVTPPRAYAQSFNLPAPGSMVLTTPAFMPVMLKGIQIHPDNPLLFDFILDTGKSGLKIDSKEFKAESQKLIRYFLASLTIKEDDLWVNLSPYEKDRMITEELGRTELGRDMLAQDYILKQLTASLIYPEKELGKKFWSRVYTRAREQFGSADIPVDTFNKVWIVADKAKVLERNNVAYVVGSHLKVMLEEDYVALEKQTAINQKNIEGNKTHTVASQIVREIVIPEIEKEVNQGQNFAPLRQMFYSMILASWYKIAIKDALLNQVYSNKGKTDGVLADDPAVKEKIYQQYLQAYKKGVFDYIKEDYDATKQEVIPRKYFSGGEKMRLRLGENLDIAHEGSPGDAPLKDGDMAMATVQVSKSIQLDAAMLGGTEEKPVTPDILNQLKTTAPMEDNLRHMDDVLRQSSQTDLGNLMAVFDIGGTITGWDKDRVEAQGGFGKVSVTLKGLLEYGYTLGAPDFQLMTDLLKKHDVKVTFISTATLEEILALMSEKMGLKSLENISLIVAKSSKDQYIPELAGKFGIPESVKTTDDLVKYLQKSNPGLKVLFSSLSKPEIVRSVKEVRDVLSGHRIIAIGDQEPDYNWVTEFGGVGIQVSSVSMDRVNYLSDAVAQGVSQLISNMAEPLKDDKAMKAPGGIDFNAKNMGLDVTKDGKGIEMKFDPAMVAEFQNGNFAGVEGVILRIVPIQSPLPMLGLEAVPVEGALAKG